MRKPILLVLLVMLAVGLVPLLSHAVCAPVDIPPGSPVLGADVCAGRAGPSTAPDNTGVWADGDAGNHGVEGHLDGYIYVGTGGLCLDDNGSPGNSTSPNFQGETLGPILRPHCHLQ